MLSVIVLRKKSGIGKNQYRQVTLPKNRKSAKKIAIGASLMITKCKIYAVNILISHFTISRNSFGVKNNNLRVSK